jgi:hypothetical protein
MFVGFASDAIHEERMAIECSSVQVWANSQSNLPARYLLTSSLTHHCRVSHALFNTLFWLMDFENSRGTGDKMNRNMLHLLILLSCAGLLLGTAVADDSSASSHQSAFGSGSAKERSNGDSGWFGIGVKTSFLGVGAEIATRVTHHTNARAGFNILGYSRNFSKDGVNYGGHLSFRTVEAHYDIYPWAGNFRISPGVLAYMGNPVTANAIVPGNQSFSLGGQTYYSDPSAPMTANGKINFNQVSPTATIGWGNLVRRNKRFSIPVEIGAAFQGSPKTTLNLTGNVCNAPGVACTSTSNSTVQSNVVAEQVKINKSLSAFKVYPIISVGFGYKF